MPKYLSSLGTVANGLAWAGPYSPPTLGIFPGDNVALFSAESLSAVVPVASIAFALYKISDSHPGSLSIEGFFSGAPGAFEIDLQTSDTDADGMYQQEGLAVTAVSANQSFRAEFLNVSAQFARILVKSLANNVALTARLSRQ